VNLAIATWGELGTALAGLNVVVSGEEHVWSQRPAVFIFNHQSAIDTLILAKILRRDFVAVAKKEVRRHPILGPAFAFAGTVFIDRYDRERAIQALAPAVEALRSGLSLVIAPEGTRSATPRLGPFKKGAFHLAMRAEVPLVPVVIRNAIDAMPKHAVVARPATVEVRVLPPVDTRSWRVAHLEDHIREVREMFSSALD
jgi:putative phosphoserine phosphatase/1-acylglycerol-3-phosphate O-acyltransferase